MGDFRIPNNWDAIGQALSEAVGAGPKATQLLEENNRAIEDAISSAGNSGATSYGLANGSGSLDGSGVGSVSVTIPSTGTVGVGVLVLAVHGVDTGITHTVFSFAGRPAFVLPCYDGEGGTFLAWLFGGPAITLSFNAILGPPGGSLSAVAIFPIS